MSKNFDQLNAAEQTALCKGIHGVTKGLGWDKKVTMNISMAHVGILNAGDK